MDHDELIAQLLLRGFVHEKQHDDKGHKVYGNGEVVVCIRGYRAMVAARFDSIEKVLEMTDYALEKANSD